MCILRDPSYICILRDITYICILRDPTYICILRGCRKTLTRSLIGAIGMNGCKFSPSKRRCLLFAVFRCHVLQPELLMNVNTKWLGLHWDQRFSWIPHVNRLKNSCIIKSPWFPKVLSNNWWGSADSQICLKFSVSRDLTLSCVVLFKLWLAGRNLWSMKLLKLVTGTS